MDLSFDLKEIVTGGGLVSASQYFSIRQGGFPSTRKHFENAMIQIRMLWINIAIGKEPRPGLNLRMQQKYADAIAASQAWIVDPSDPFTIVISPDQKIAHMCEDFISPYDLKEGILEGPNARHYTQDGKVFKNVPFRHYWGDSKHPDMPEEIYNIIKPQSEGGQKRPYLIERLEVVNFDRKTGKMRTDVIGTIKKRGDRILEEDIPDSQKENKTRKFWALNKQAKSDADPIVKMIGEHTRTRSRYTGMIRMEKTYEILKNEPQYMTWRRVSENSPKWSWIHPGFPANRVSDVVIREAYPILKEHVLAGLADDMREFFTGGKS